MFSLTPPAQAVDELRAIMADVHPLAFRMMATALAEADTRSFLSALSVPRLPRSDPLRVVDPRGNEVASEGDTVTVGGGWDGSWSEICQSLGAFHVIELAKGEPSFAP